MTTDDNQLAPLPENPTPQDFGFPENPRSDELLCWQRQEVFLAELAKHGRVADAASAAGVTIWAAYAWDSRDVYNYKKRKAAALEVYDARLDTEIDRRAVDGILKPLHYKGEIFGHVREYSDNLLMFRRKQRDPSYRDNYAPSVSNTTNNTQIIFNYAPGIQAPKPPGVTEPETRELASGADEQSQ